MQLRASRPLRQFILYGIVGALNAVFTFLIFYVSLRALRLPYLVALIVAFLLGNILTYALNYLFVFQVGTRFSLDRLWHYILGNGTIFAVNLAALAAIVEGLAIDPLWGQVLLMAPLVLFNFLIVKFWSLRKRARPAEP